MISLEELHANLRDALLAAGDTSAIRQAIAEAEAAEARAAREAAQRAAERTAAEETRIRREAEGLATAAADRVAAALAALAPPPPPLGAR